MTVLAQLVQLIQMIRRGGAGDVCDSAALLHDSKIVFSDSLDNVRNSLHKLQIAFPAGTASRTEADFAQCGAEILHFSRQHSVYHLIVRGEEETLRAQFAGMQPVVLDVMPLTLEEVFIYELEVLGYGNYKFDTDTPSV